MKKWVACVFSLLLAFAGSASAQVTLSQNGFESSSLPAGWDGTTAAGAGETLSTSTALPHDGTYSLRLRDIDATGTGEVPGQAIFDSLANLTGDLAFGMWFQAGALGGSGYASFFDVYGFTSGQFSMAHLAITSTGGLSLQGFDATGTIVVDTPVGGLPLNTGQWYYVEVVIRGIGTSSAVRELWIDGTRRTQTNVNLTGAAAHQMYLGAVYLSRAWTGTLYFDTFSLQRTPSKLVFTTTSRVVPPSTCSGSANVITVQQQQSSNTAINADSDGTAFTLTSSSPGTVTFYTDNTCSTVASGGNFTIPSGASSVNVYFQDTVEGMPQFSLSNSLGLTNPAPQTHKILTPFFQDDFESGTLLLSSAPAGRWESISGPETSLTFSASTSAAHRGNYGVRLVDEQNKNAGSSYSRWLSRSVHNLTGDIYVRYWMRFAAQTGTSPWTDVFALRYPPTSNYVVNFAFSAGSPNSVHVGANTSSATYSFDGSPFDLVIGEWNLIEISVIGLGTASARQRLWVNGQQLGDVTTAQTGRYASEYMLGQASGDPQTWMGQLDFDDFRSSATPHASRLHVSLAASVDAGTCAPVTVTLRDSVASALAGAPYAFTASLGSTGVVGELYSNSSCTSSTTSVDFAPGQNTQTVYFRATTTGSATLDASFTDFLTGSTTTTVMPEDPAQLAFTTPVRTFTAGACAGSANVITVQLQDSLGNPVNAGSGGQSFTASSNSMGTVTWYTDASCSTIAPSGNFTIPSGSDTVSLYYRDTQAGTPTLSLTNGSGLSTPTPQQHTVLAGAPASLVFRTAPRTQVAGACSEALTVRIEDAHGNPSAVASLTQVSLSSTKATTAFFSDAFCTSQVSSMDIPAAGASVTFHARDTASGTPTLTASVSGLPAATQVLTVQPATSSVLVFTSPAHTVTAGSCSPLVRVQSRDAYGNASAVGSNTALTLSSTSGSHAFYSDGACSLPLTSPMLANGETDFSLYFRDTAAGTPVLRVSSATHSQITQSHTIMGGPAAALVVTGLPSNPSAGMPFDITVVATDAYGNPASGYTGTVTVTSSDGNAILPAPLSYDGNVPSRTVSVTFNTAGSQSLTLTDDSMPPLSITPPAVAVQVGNASALRVTGIGSPLLVGESSSVTVEIRDASGNRVTGYTGTVHFTSSDTSATLPPDYTFVASDNGLRTFANAVRFNTGGSHSITVTDTSNPAVNGTQSGIQVLLPQGTGCSSNSECGTGFCSNGVCCDGACTGNNCRACNVPGSVGACAPVTNGTACSDGAYCNGAETCQAGTCQAGSPIICTDPYAYEAQACAESTQSCEKVPNSAPTIVENAVLTAGAGIPYVYNSDGAIQALGERPLTFLSCGGPPGFAVEPQSGAVSWVPSGTGPVSLCVEARNAFGADTYSFAVNVVTAVGGPPVAAYTVTPPQGPAPLAVGFDASDSLTDPSTTLAAYSWRYGNGAQRGSGRTSALTYRTPGSYRSSLTITDGYGRQSTAQRPVSVLTPDGRRPPSARIVTSAQWGADALDVNFTCECEPGDAPIRARVWDFGSQTVMGPTPTHTFLPGRHHVRLLVVDEAGLTAQDEVEIAVEDLGRTPPTCEATAIGPEGTVPVSSILRAHFNQPAGSIVSVRWTLWDGRTVETADVPVELLNPGHFTAKLEVVDDQGLTCTDAVTLVAFQPGEASEGERVPPRLLHVANVTAECGIPAAYDAGELPLVAGSGPFVFDLEASAGETLHEGLRVDSATGGIRWTPGPQSVGLGRFLLRVTGPGGTDLAPVELVVTCGSSVRLGLGCGCNSGFDSLPPVLALLALVGAARIQRRRR